MKEGDHERLRETLMAAFRSKAMYMSDHPRVREMIEEGLEHWRDLDTAVIELEESLKNVHGPTATDLRILLDAIR